MSTTFRSLALVLLALAFGVTPARAAHDPALDDLARVIVKATTTSDPAPLVARFEAGFGRDYAKANGRSDELIIDFDWTTNSQDPDMEAVQKTIETKIDEVSDSDATIIVTFLHSGRSFLIHYLVHKGGAKWVVVDVTYPNEDFSLRELVRPQ